MACSKRLTVELFYSTKSAKSLELFNPSYSESSKMASSTAWVMPSAA